jgi:acyl transferase domain-containing protein
MNQKDFCATWTSHLFNLCGPSVSVYSACSTSLVAIREAMDALIMGRADICIAGGVNLVLPEDIGHHYQSGMVLASEGHCRPFDINATGIIRGKLIFSYTIVKDYN